MGLKLTDQIPAELERVLNEEPFDFILKNQRDEPFWLLMKNMGFALLILFFVSLFPGMFFVPLLLYGKVDFELNGEPAVATWDNLDPLFWPSIIIGSFLVFGLIYLSYTIYSFLKNGGWVIGTPSALIYYNKNKKKIMDWEQFTGDMEIRGNQQKGEIHFTLKTGQWVKAGSSRKYRADKFYIVGVPNIAQIESICRKRIEECGIKK